jgi:hypothetical protein
MEPSVNAALDDVTTQKIRTPSVSFAQLIFFDKVKDGGKYRTAMARVALTVGKQDSGDPMLLSEMLDIHAWDQYHSVLDFLHYSSSVVITWDPMQRSALQSWVAE